jgi:hypothetical protein
MKRTPRQGCNIRLVTLAFALAIPFRASAAQGSPQIYDLSPAAGSASGTTVVRFTGQNLAGPPLLCPAVSCSTYVQFDSKPATVLSISEDEIVVRTPDHAAGTVDGILHIQPDFDFRFTFRYLDSSVEAHEKLLLPILGGGPGAFGSVWSTILSVHNGGGTPLAVSGPFLPPGVIFGGESLSGFRVDADDIVRFSDSSGGEGAAFINLPSQSLDSTDVQLQVRDLSKNAQDYGTEIPVVRAAAFRQEIRLTDIPTDARFRTSLRIYSYSTPTVVAVSFYDADHVMGRPPATTPLFTDIVSLTAPPNTVGFSFFPATGRMSSLLAAHPELAGYPRIRLEVRPLSSTSPAIWAFVSVTNNESQRVTIISPQ